MDAKAVGPDPGRHRKVASDEPQRIAPGITMMVVIASPADGATTATNIIVGVGVCPLWLAPCRTTDIDVIPGLDNCHACIMDFCRLNCR